MGFFLLELLAADAGGASSSGSPVGVASFLTGSSSAAAGGDTASSSLVISRGEWDADLCKCESTSDDFDGVGEQAVASHLSTSGSPTSVLREDDRVRRREAVGFLASVDAGEAGR